MAMEMNEVFYGASEPTYMAQHFSHAPYSYADTRESRPSSHTNYSDSMFGMNAVELLVPMCCKKCEEKVKEKLMALEGVYEVVCDSRSRRVSVTGYANPLRVLKKARKVKKGSEFWYPTSHNWRSHAGDPDFPKYDINGDQHEISDNTVCRVSCTQKVPSNNHKQYFFRPIYEEVVSYPGIMSTNLQHYCNYN